MKLALYQGPGRINDVEGGFTHMAQLAGQAAASGANLLLLPEMYLSGYNIGLTSAATAAITTDGAEMARAGKIAAANNIALAFGYPEKVGEDVANSVILLGPDGKVLLNYRKSHLFGDTDRGMFKAIGQEFGLAELGGFKIGLLICYDIEFPEPARRLALLGADIILVPTAQMEPYDQVAIHVIPARAYENQVFLAYANHTGSDDGFNYIGLSSICGPNGAVLAAAGRDEELIYATLDAAHQAEIRKADPLFRDRRPELYAALAAKS